MVVPQLSHLSLLALAGSFNGIVAQLITSDTYFYGESPPVYPSPKGSGVGDWASSYAKAAAFVAKLTLEEKANLTFGYSDPTSGCVGAVPPIDRVGFPGLCLQDAGNGVRAADLVSSFPSGIHVGASWNADLAAKRGKVMGLEFRTKGVNVALGPVVGPLGRVVESGRNWEGVSSDPYLCGALAAETVTGIQSQGVITSVKHFIGNEQETNRNPSTSNGQSIESVSSNIDDKTLHELYLWPFQDTLRAGSGNIMCSYNRLNNSHGCANSKILNGILKTELGYQGFVVSDWGAQHNGVASALAGLDMAMPSGNFWGGPTGIAHAVSNGSVPESRLDDMATRILAAWYQMKQDQGYPARGVGIPKSITAPHKPVNAIDPSTKDVLLDGAIEGHVLVKNINNALPLKVPSNLALYGYDGIANYGGNLVSQNNQIRNYTMIVAGGSGANVASYISAPYDALQARAYQDGSFLTWDFVNNNGGGSLNGAADACLVFINAWATEGSDRQGLADAYSDNLVLNVASKCANTIVVIHNAGARIVDAFAENPNVTAIIYAHLPGQDSGRALVSLLYGDEVFSGKLPYTVAKTAADYGPLLAPSKPSGDFALFPQSNFSEGVYIDYKYFDANNIEPRYEFGFGLSYTTFEYSNLAVSKTGHNWKTFPSGGIEQGGDVDLWDNQVTVRVNVKNTGSVDGMEIAQLYVGIPGGPVRVLRGFDKVKIHAGATANVEFKLTRRDLSTWDTTAQNWRLQTGTYNVYVGSSSRNLPLKDSFTV
ncbi:putative beta-glucosidase M [Xylogone sp. PMI_703]|nr:putative beta-glucosidase M [Xylogone sp. PMI_703]